MKPDICALALTCSFNF